MAGVPKAVDHVMAKIPKDKRADIFHSLTPFGLENQSQ